MEAEVRAALEAAAGPGWRVARVGGAARRAPGGRHDADFLCARPARPWDGALLQAVELLDAGGRLAPAGSGALRRVQAGLLRGGAHVARLKPAHLREAGAAPGKQKLDRFDHAYMIFRTRAGRYRRLDVIICPPDEWAFAYLGWTGSRTYLRWQRQFAAAQAGLWLGSHGAFVKEGRESFRVPGERPPPQNAAWPAGRRCEEEADVFAMLGLPFRPPWERACP
jgi:hypothetical protein